MCPPPKAEADYSLGARQCNAIAMWLSFVPGPPPSLVQKLMAMMTSSVPILCDIFHQPFDHCRILPLNTHLYAKIMRQGAQVNFGSAKILTAPILEIPPQLV